MIGQVSTSARSAGSIEPAFFGSAESRSNRLVKAGECPTRINKTKNDYKKQIAGLRSKAYVQSLDKIDIPPAELVPDIKTPGTKATLEFRQFCDEYRLRCHTEAGNKPPPIMEGDRLTDNLTASGERKLIDSAFYVHTLRGGYSTFLTLTLDNNARRRIQDQPAAGRYSLLTDKPKKNDLPHTSYGHCPIARPVIYGLSIQKEVSRFFDGVQKIYQRGWQYQAAEGPFNWLNQRPWGALKKKNKVCPLPLEPTVKKAGAELMGPAIELQEVSRKKYGRRVIKCLGYRPVALPEKLDYMWVVEVPENEQGEENPHIHVLMRWKVPRNDFEAWAKRLEKLWGHGFANLQPIKHGEAAGAYMVKAAGYLTKGEDQGTVRGNRYAISASARAESWKIVGQWQLGIMGSIIREVYDRVTHKYGELFRRRAELKEQRNTAIQNKEKIQPRVTQELNKIREKLSAIKCAASKYQLIIKGKTAFNKFIGWMRGAGFIPEKKPDSLWLRNCKRLMYDYKKMRGAWAQWQLDSVQEYYQAIDENWQDTLSRYEQLTAANWTFLDGDDWRAALPE